MQPLALMLAMHRICKHLVLLDLSTGGTAGIRTCKSNNQPDQCIDS